MIANNRIEEKSLRWIMKEIVSILKEESFYKEPQ
ncbi:hypothetical protein SAMN05421510_100594 [Nitrosomonas ureae]|uniref:Uncharacterized protein n=1 Tax=Nitrosomonas ureae TaxID=44577 RepID=A0A1H9AZT8_9PROT|nr:hypothetical protein SAMN05216406_10635 [Nitrosomonas ureae]SEP82045.1 hypothetical protein SAMN05421510_100594 [Nitrosomonas ureae]SOD17804.1 hypothetical protein SAMN06297164_1362 [Nitrosomonas ureae]